MTTPAGVTGVLEVHQKGHNIPDNSFDLIEVIISTYEDEQERAIALRRPPLRNFHRQYLNGVALRMNSMSATILFDADAKATSFQ